MNFLPKSIERLIEALRILPGIGQKTAERLAFFLLKSSDSNRENIGKAILEAKNNVHFCSRCFHFADNDQCAICQNLKRDHSKVCLVEDWLDLIAIEKSTVFKGIFHVLGGVLSPLDGIGPEQLKIAQFLERVKQENFSEIIIATNPTIEGEATAVYVVHRLKNFSGKITRLSRGLPVGGDLEYIDEHTIKSAFQERKDF